MTIDTSSDFAAIDNTETVTLFSKTADGTYSPTSGTTVESAMRGPADKSDLAPALLAKQVVGFSMWTAKLGGVVPKIGDVVQDSHSVRWTAVKVEVMVWGTCFRCTCVRER